MTPEKASLSCSCSQVLPGPPALMSHGNQTQCTLAPLKHSHGRHLTALWCLKAPPLNESVLGRAVCQPDVLTVTKQSGIEAHVLILLLLPVHANVSALCSHPQSGEDRSPQRWPPAGKSLTWLSCNEQLLTLGASVQQWLHYIYFLCPSWFQMVH